jgi:Uma2 family endonuclease
MNVHLRQPPPLTTQSAEDQPRCSWTIDEIEAMVAADISDPKERFELTGREIVPMSPKGNRHESVKRVLARYGDETLPPEIDLLPDLAVCQSALGLSPVTD